MYIGTQEARVEALAEEVLTCVVPEVNPGKECIDGTVSDHPCVVV